MPDQLTWTTRGQFWRLRSEAGQVRILRADRWPSREPADWSSGPYRVRDHTPYFDIEDDRVHSPLSPTWSVGLLWGTNAATTIIVDDRVTRRWGDFAFVSAPPGTTRRVGYHELCFSLWLPALLFASAPGLWALRRLVRSAQGGLRRDRRLCPDCGYNLRGTPNYCPECGWRADADPGPSWLLDDR